ncbi:MAG: DUF669 domain-containing protein [Deferribacteraceae bacterium]|jgi:hypothetical protein|nr:DUF669 domain-containing protein [Deferribacteraceae bacterium]
MAQINIDMTNVEESHDKVVLPPGEYRVRVSGSEVRRTKKLDRLMATFALQLEGNAKYNGLILWEHFLLDNEIAQKRLKSFAIAAGHNNPNFIRDTTELHGMLLMVKVNIKNTPGYGEQNNITAFKTPGERSLSAGPSGARTPWR